MESLKKLQLKFTTLEYPVFRSTLKFTIVVHPSMKVSEVMKIEDDFLNNPNTSFKAFPSSYDEILRNKSYPTTSISQPTLWWFFSGKAILFTRSILPTFHHVFLPFSPFFIPTLRVLGKEEELSGIECLR